MPDLVFYGMRYHDYPRPLPCTCISLKKNAFCFCDVSLPSNHCYRCGFFFFYGLLSSTDSRTEKSEASSKTQAVFHLPTRCPSSDFDWLGFDNVASR